MKYYLKVKNTKSEITKDTFYKMKNDDYVHIYASHITSDSIIWCCVDKENKFFELVEEN